MAIVILSIPLIGILLKGCFVANREEALQLFLGCEQQLKGNMIPFASEKPPWVS